MKVGDLIILDEREVGGAWNEYLCFEKTSEGYELSTRHREILGDDSDYYNEDGDIELPDEIDGEAVYTSVNGIILGESLIINNFLNCGDQNDQNRSSHITYYVTCQKPGGINRILYRESRNETFTTSGF